MESTNNQNQGKGKHKRGKNKNKGEQNAEPKPRVDNYIIAQNIKNEKFELNKSNQFNVINAQKVCKKQCFFSFFLRIHFVCPS